MKVGGSLPPVDKYNYNGKYGKKLNITDQTQQTIYSELFRTIGTIENFLELFGTLVLNNYNGNFFRTFENFSSNNILY